MMGTKPDGAIAGLRRMRELAHDDREIVRAIHEGIGQFDSLSRSGVRVPRIVHASDKNFPTLCYERRYFTASAAIRSTAFAPGRYNAACSAVLAGCSQGNDPPADEVSRAGLRTQALDWLAADLRLVSDSLDTTMPESPESVRSIMKHWQQDADLAGIRDAEQLAKLPEAERKEWKSLWADVDALLKKSDRR